MATQQSVGRRFRSSGRCRNATSPPPRQSCPRQGPSLNPERPLALSADAVVLLDGPDELEQAGHRVAAVGAWMPVGAPAEPRLEERQLGPSGGGKTGDPETSVEVVRPAAETGKDDDQRRAVALAVTLG